VGNPGYFFIPISFFGQPQTANKFPANIKSQQFLTALIIVGRAGLQKRSLVIALTTKKKTSFRSKKKLLLKLMAMCFLSRRKRSHI